MNQKESLFFIGLILFFWSHLAEGKEIVVPFDGEYINVTKESAIHFDYSLSKNIEDILDKDSSILFQATNDSIILSKGRLDKNYWIRLHLSNTTNKDESYMLNIRDPFIHHLQLYQSINGILSTEVDESGIYIPYGKRKINYREHVSVIKVPAHSSNTVYIKINKFSKSIRLNLELWKTIDFFEKSNRFDLIIGILYGVFIIYSFIVFILFLQFRNKFFLGYLLYIFGNLLYNFSNSGMLYQYALGDYPGPLNALIRPWSLFFTAMGLLYFAHHLFNQPIISSKLHKIRKAYHVFYILIFIFGSSFYFLMPQDYLIAYISIFSLLGQILCFSGILLSAFIVGNYYLKYKSKDALIIVIAYLLLFGFGIVYILQSHFKIVYTNPFFAENNGLTLLGLEASIMAIAIIVRLSEIIKSREELKLQVERQKLALSKSLMKGEENERKRVSKELHDSIGSYLSTIGLYVDQLNNEGDLQQKIRSLITTTTNEVRQISQDMMPYNLTHHGLISSLQLFIKDINQSNSIKIVFNSKIKEPHLNNFQKINIYRITQELINNAIKYAEAEIIFVQIKIINNRLKILVEDDGKGFNTNQIESDNKNAFHALKFRAGNLKGTFNIDSQENEGTSIHLEFPLISE